MIDTPARRILKRLSAEKAALTETFADELVGATMFLMPLDETDFTSETNIAAVYAELEAHFTVEQKKLTTDKLPLGIWREEQAHAALVAFVIKKTSGAIVSSVLQSFFAQRAENGLPKQRRVRLPNYGLLLPRTCEIKCHSFAHGKGHYYRFRLAQHKLNRLPKSLLDFLLTLPSNCPNAFFSTGPRASNFEVPLRVEVTHLKNHPCIDYAKAALGHRRFKSAHEDIEKYMLENDPDCVATEVPLWLDNSEMNKYVWARSQQGCLTGHIDILRYEPDHLVGIWDFKPSAASSIRARIQTFLYALMLSTRTGLPLYLFRCGYFDNEDAFVFQASQVTRLQ
jgi:hypothetical protein